jgi:hypothetical protein
MRLFFLLFFFFLLQKRMSVCLGLALPGQNKSAYKKLVKILHESEQKMKPKTKYERSGAVGEKLR